MSLRAHGERRAAPSATNDALSDFTQRPPLAKDPQEDARQSWRIDGGVPARRRLKEGLFAFRDFVSQPP
jgi:hypothetical protein